MSPAVDQKAFPTELWRIVDAQAPPERLAMLRILTGMFAVAYLAIRLPVFVQLAERESGFDGIGVASVLTGPVSDWVLLVLIGVTFVAGLAYTVGWQYRRLAPVFAVGLAGTGELPGLVGTAPALREPVRPASVDRGARPSGRSVVARCEDRESRRMPGADELRLADRTRRDRRRDHLRDHRSRKAAVRRDRAGSSVTRCAITSRTPPLASTCSVLTRHRSLAWA